MKMPKVITLEKAADGSYEVPKNAKVEIIPDEKPVSDQPIYERRVYKTPARPINDTRKVHQFIVKHGTNASEFLEGVNKTIKVLNLVKKLIK